MIAVVCLIFLFAVMVPACMIIEYKTLQLETGIQEKAVGEISFQQAYITESQYRSRLYAPYL
jgi:hypothetical protein